MTETIKNGRLGNQIIRNLAVSLIAEKHNLNVKYCNEEAINKLGINLFSGNKTYDTTIILSDNNYFNIYNCHDLSNNLNPNLDYFQTSEIINLLYKYLRTDTIRSAIIENNPFKNRYAKNNDVFIHIRLTDVAHFNPGIGYYINTLRSIQFDKLYVSTDEPHHDIVQTILKIYSHSELINCNEIHTFQFGSTCKHIILSHGSFSAIIGYLAFFSNVYYPQPQFDKMWYGNMFSIDGWNECSVNKL